MEKLSLLKYIDNRETPSCKDYQKMIPDFIENRLELKDEHIFVSHLRKCKECLEEFEANYMFASAFKFLGDDSAAEFTTDIEVVLSKSESKYKNFKRQKMTIITEIITVGILVGVLAGLVLSQNFREIFIWGK